MCFDKNGNLWIPTGDGLNMFNANAPTAVTYASGPSFRNVTNAVPPRNIRVGASFNF